MEKEALFYKNENDIAICELCPHNCHIHNEKYGLCGVRKAINNTIITENYGEISSMALDPIEKKPLFHFNPGKKILSVGSFGCNLSCSFCQNYSISKDKPSTTYISPEKLISIAEQYKDEGNIGIAFTYNEPSIYYEYIYDTVKNCSNKDLSMVLVTNGYISEAPLKDLLPYIHAVNIDLKAFTNKFYKSICNGDVTSVMNTIKIAESKCHVEVTTLLVTGYNDSEDEIGRLSKWLSSINPNIPLHLTAYRPAYKFSAPPTPKNTLIRCKKAAERHLNYVYIGNSSEEDCNTYCIKCKNLLVERKHFHAKSHIDYPVCPKCGYGINMIL